MFYEIVASCSQRLSGANYDECPVEWTQRGGGKTYRIVFKVDYKDVDTCIVFKVDYEDVDTCIVLVNAEGVT